MISFTTRRLGGSFNRSPISSAKINAKFNIWITENPSGYASISGHTSTFIYLFPSAGGTIYTSGYAHPWMDLFPAIGGSIISSGHSAQSYAQLQVTGGEINWSEFITRIPYGYLETPSGYVEVSGEVQARPVIKVQIMHTERTAIVPGYDTELFIENLFTEANVVRTEERQTDIPAVVDYYI